MLAKVLSGTVYGVDGRVITVEVDIAPGLPSLSIVGLPDASVKEARDRVVAAIRNSGFDFPVKKITVNLAPADLRKEGSAFDLPMAWGILLASESVTPDDFKNWAMVGELALDGTLRPVKGILSIALEMEEKNLEGMVVPLANVPEARVVKGLRILGAKCLKDVAEYFSANQTVPISSEEENPEPVEPEKTEHDFEDVKGQPYAKRALEIAAAGAHNIIMIGPPGSGKTMLSRRIPSILPPLTFEESVQTTKIHSVAGLIHRASGLVQIRPFRSPHHTISDIALIGGGQTPRPGEVSLAHHGVLFLDELPEFHRNALEVLRQPLEAREVVVARAKETLTFPASFMLVAAMNPCPCGFYGHPARICICTPHKIQKYMAKISGPLLDRMDIHLDVPPLKTDELTEERTGMETSREIRGRVVRARKIQKERLKGTKVFANAQMNARLTRKFCSLDAEGKNLIRRAIEQLGLSARAYDRILKVARTISDLSQSESIEPAHLAEAIQYRSLDRLKN